MDDAAVTPLDRQPSKAAKVDDLPPQQPKTVFTVTSLRNRIGKCILACLLFGLLGSVGITNLIHPPTRFSWTGRGSVYNAETKAFREVDLPRYRPKPGDADPVRELRTEPDPNAWSGFWLFTAIAALIYLRWMRPGSSQPSARMTASAQDVAT